MCLKNFEKHNICMFSNFGKDARSADVSRSIRNVCISLKNPIWVYMGFSIVFFDIFDPPEARFPHQGRSFSSGPVFLEVSDPPKARFPHEGRSCVEYYIFLKNNCCWDTLARTSDYAAEWHRFFYKSDRLAEAKR